MLGLNKAETGRCGERVKDGETHTQRRRLREAESDTHSVRESNEDRNRQEEKHRGTDSKRQR